MLVNPPDEFSTQVTPGEMGLTVGLEVVTQVILPVTRRRLNADAVSDQSDHVEAAGLAGAPGRRGRAGRGGSQLDGVIHSEVLQLDQLTFRHPVDMSSVVVHELGGAVQRHPVAETRQLLCGTSREICEGKKTVDLNSTLIIIISPVPFHCLFIMYRVWFFFYLTQCPFVFIQLHICTFMRLLVYNL